MEEIDAIGSLDACQQLLNYKFRNSALLREALTHASVAPTRQVSNERLEFLGDAVLGLIVCQHLFESHPDYLEGELTKIKSDVVSRHTCAEIARGLGLTEVLFLGKGISSQSQLPSSLIAAALESIIGAIYLDGGIDAARTFIIRVIAPYVEESVRSEHRRNFKSQLQQHAQKVLGSTPSYEVLDEKGPDHSKCFEIAVCIDGRRFPSAWGRSKKEAEQKAACIALVEMNLLSADVEPVASLD